MAIVGPTLVTLATLPVLTIVLFALASHVARPGQRVAMALLAVVVIAVGEWSLALGLVVWLAYAVLVRHNILHTWRSMRPRWHLAWPHLQQLHQRAEVLLRRLLMNVKGIRRCGGVRPWLAAQFLRGAVALTPHPWARKLPTMPGMIGIPLRLDQVSKVLPTLDEATRALREMQPIVNLQDDAPTDEMAAV